MRAGLRLREVAKNVAEEVEQHVRRGMHGLRVEVALLGGVEWKERIWVEEGASMGCGVVRVVHVSIGQEPCTEGVVIPAFSGVLKDIGGKMERICGLARSLAF